MITYEVIQALLSVGTLYHVRRPRDATVLFTVRAVSTSRTLKFRLLEGEAETGKEVGTLTTNFIRTRYEIGDPIQTVASLVFPPVAFEKTLTLTVGDDVYEADGGVFRGIFTCRRRDGEVVLEIAKELSIRDTFSVKASGSLPFQVGLLSSVAIHSRFYQMV